MAKTQSSEKHNKQQTENSETQTTPKTVPNKTLKDDQCRYCKDACHTAKDCPKLAERRELEEGPDAPNVQIAKPQALMKKTAILVQ